MESFDGPILRNAAENIHKNKAVVDQIEKLTDQDLDKFLEDCKVFTFESQSTAGVHFVLFTLSSFEGSRAYMSKQNVGYTNQMPTQKLLEHELMHNLSRWQKEDPRRISPAKNKNLIIRGHMVEACDFYEHNAYQEPILRPCPFCLSESKRKKY